MTISHAWGKHTEYYLRVISSITSGTTVSLASLFLLACCSFCRGPPFPLGSTQIIAKNDKDTRMSFSGTIT